MLSFGIKNTIAERVYSIAEKGTRIRLRNRTQTSFNKIILDAGTEYTLRDVDSMGVLYLCDDTGAMYCVPYSEDLFEKV